MKFPKRLLKRIKSYLEKERLRTEKRLETVKAEDPFADSDRRKDKAAVDTEVKVEGAHDRVEAIRRELLSKLSRIERALIRVRKGGYGKCEDCGETIDAKRLKIVPAATLCVKCEKKREGK